MQKKLRGRLGIRGSRLSIAITSPLSDWMSHPDIMRPEEFQKILNRYQKGRCSPEEEALVEKWFAAMGTSDSHDLQSSDRTDIKQRSWVRVQRYIKARGARQRTSRMNTRTYWAIAAAILIVMVSTVFVLVRNRPTDRMASSVDVVDKNILNDTDEVMKVVLSDGSRILLRPESSIRYREPFDNSQRLVALEGEAFFEVFRDPSRPFLVNTNEVITKVLGTSFTVSAFPSDDNITVSVVTGKVAVMTKQDSNADDSPLRETILTPNQKITYDKNKNLVSLGIVNEPVQILSPDIVRRMQFEAAPIADIFRGLEQVYGVDIEFDEDTFSSCILTTSIAEGSIYNRLNMICKAIDAQYVLKGNQIVITGAGCGP